MMKQTPSNVVSLEEFRKKKKYNLFILIIEIPISAPIMKTPFSLVELRFAEVIIMRKKNEYLFNYVIYANKPKERTNLNRTEINDLEKISRSQLIEELAWLGQNNVLKTIDGF